jgi:hypothetical protein
MASDSSVNNSLHVNRKTLTVFNQLALDGIRVEGLRPIAI